MARDKSEQRKREDPNAWQRFILKPRMSPAIAVHPNHPAYLGWDYATNPAPEGLQHEFPVLLLADADMDWGDQVPLGVMGGALDPKGVLYLLVDGVRRVADAWKKESTIEARGAPAADVEPYTEHNNHRRQDILAAEDAFALPGGCSGARDYYTLGDRATTLSRQGHTPAAIMGRLKISPSILDKSTCVFRAWRRLGVSPMAANTPPRTLTNIEVALANCLREGSQDMPHLTLDEDRQQACFLRALPALLRGLVVVADIARENHAALSPTQPPAAFSRRPLLLAAKAMADLVLSFEGEQPADLTYEAMGRMAAAKGIFAGLTGDIVAAVKEHRFHYGAIQHFANRPVELQQRALGLAPEKSAWTRPNAAKQWVYRLKKLRQAKELASAT